MTGILEKPAWRCAAFHELEAADVYAMLQLRAAVFVLEQKCFYQDADDHDQNAHHLLAYSGDDAGRKLVACARLFPPQHRYHGAVWPQARIGRIATHADCRGIGLGHAIMTRSLQEIARLYGDGAVVLSAQAHLEGFYRQHGFVREGAAYDEDGIPHIDMVRPLPRHS